MEHTPLRVLGSSYCHAGNMPNIGAVLKQEITRIARKELRGVIAPVRKAGVTQRRAIARLKRQVAALERQVKVLGAPPKRDTASAPAEQPSFRFRPTTVVKHRQRLGLSAEDFGALVGVSGQTIYNWERGKRPRAKQLAVLSAIRQLGKRPALARLEVLRASTKNPPWMAKRRR